MQNGNHPPPAEQPSPEGLRQRRPPQILALVFRSNSQTAYEIRNGKHTKEFYIRHGLLPVSSEPQ